MKTVFVTFSSRQFLPRAEVTMKSVREFHPECAEETVVLHDAQMDGDYVSGLAKLRLEKAKELLKIYDEVVVIGADCVLYDRVDSFLNTFGKVVLIPHVVTLPKNNAPQLYMTGHCNADLMLFRRGSEYILDWLIEQPMKAAIHAGSFYEQTLLSALPFITSDVEICRDPAINVAYFNLHERTVIQYWSPDDKLKYFVRFGDRELPLKMFQFSGFVNAETLSKYSMLKYYPSDVHELAREYEKKITC